MKSKKHTEQEREVMFFGVKWLNNILSNPFLISGVRINITGRTQDWQKRRESSEADGVTAWAGGQDSVATLVSKQCVGH